MYMYFIYYIIYVAKHLLFKCMYICNLILIIKKKEYRKKNKFTEIKVYMNVEM